MFSSRHRRESAFTILELMVATTITSILIVVLVTVGIATIDAWGSSRSFTRYQASARAALDLLDSDLRSMLSRNRLPGEVEAAAPWLEAKYERTAGTTSATLSFFARVTDLEPDWEGDLAAVRYQLVNQDPVAPGVPNSPGSIISLYRAVADPESTLEGALEAKDIEGEFWLGEKVDDPINFLARNVVILSVEFWVRGTDGVRRRADWGSSGRLQIDRRLRARWEGEDASVAPFRLAGIDLAVEVVSDRGMSLLRDGVPISEVPAAERRAFSQFVPVLPER